MDFTDNAGNSDNNVNLENNSIVGTTSRQEKPSPFIVQFPDNWKSCIKDLDDIIHLELNSELSGEYLKYLLKLLMTSVSCKSILRRRILASKPYILKVKDQRKLSSEVCLLIRILSTS